MRRWIIDRHGRDSLHMDETPKPGPATGEILVSVSAVALNARDALSAPTIAILLKAPIVQGIVTGHRRALEDLVRAVNRTALKPVIGRRCAFEDLPVALDHLGDGAFGKIVIDLPTTRS